MRPEIKRGNFSILNRNAAAERKIHVSAGAIKRSEET